MEKNNLNVVMIIADQLSARALSYMGRSQAITPNIDRLAARSLNLTRATSQAPICMPSRASFNTGLYPQTVSVNENPYVLHDKFKTLAEYMGEAGYATGGFGHLGGDGLERGYDACCDLPDEPLCIAWQNEQNAVTGEGGLSASYTGILPFPEEESLDGLVAKFSTDFIKSQRGREQPFFLQTAFYKPHTPWIVPQNYIDLYDSDKLELPATWTGEDMKGKHPFMTDNRKAIVTDIMSESERKRSLQYYYGAISFIDDKVGQILDALDEEGLTDNTMVIFMADHGDFGLEHGTMNKMGAFYDCLVNVPLLIAHPGSDYRKGEKDDSLVELTDLMPTILDICGVESERSLPGRSMRGLMTGKGIWNRKRAITQVISGTGQDEKWRRGEVELKPLKQDPYAAGPLAFCISGDMIIRDGFKLIYYKDGFTELYNLEEDPDEISNLSGKEEYIPLEFKLTKELLSWELESIAMGDKQEPLCYHYKASALHHMPECFVEEKLKWEERRNK